MKKITTLFYFVLIAFCILPNFFFAQLCFNPVINFTTGSGTKPNYVATADFNGDGRVDLAVTDYWFNDVLVLMGTGTGAFGSPVFFGAGNSPKSITSSDFNVTGNSI